MYTDLCQAGLQLVTLILQHGYCASSRCRARVEVRSPCIRTRWFACLSTGTRFGHYGVHDIDVFACIVFDKQRIACVLSGQGSVSRGLARQETLARTVMRCSICLDIVLYTPDAPSGSSLHHSSKHSANSSYLRVHSQPTRSQHFVA